MKQILFIIIFLFAIFTILPFSKTNDYNFENLTTSDGLSSNLIRCLFQDSKGFLWIGTDYGINRYDGKEFKIFNHDPRDNNSLPSIYGGLLFFEDSFGSLWMITAKSLSKYNRSTGNFTNYFSDLRKSNQLHGRIIKDIKEDHNRQLWIGTNRGVSRYLREKDHFKNYPLNTKIQINLRTSFSIVNNNPGTIWVYNIDHIFKYNQKNDTFESLNSIKKIKGKLSSNKITSVLGDKSGGLFIGTQNGFNIYSNKDSLIKTFLADQDNPNSLNHNFVNYLFLNNQDELLIGTFDGINKYDVKTNDLTKFFIPDQKNRQIQLIFEDQSNRTWVLTNSNLLAKKKTEKKFKEVSLLHNYNLTSKECTYILNDKSGVLWIGTYGQGLFKLSGSKNKFNILNKNKKESSSVINHIFSILLEKNDIIWAGSHEGLYRIDRKNNQYSLFSEGLNSSLTVFSILAAEDNNFWIGTNRGLFKFDKIKNVFTKFISNSNNKLLKQATIFQILPYYNNTLLIGSDKGLLQLNKGAKEVDYYLKSYPDNSLSTNIFVMNVVEDSKKNIWIGTRSKGVFKIEPEKLEIKHYQSDESRKNSISTNDIGVIFEDSNKNIWIGTNGGGLNKFDDQTSSFSYYTTSNGLINNSVLGILEDKNGFLWISTLGGISKFNQTRVEFTNFSDKDGLIEGDFSTNSYFKAENGEIFFGGTKGLVHFYPEKIKLNKIPPELYINNFRIDGHSIKGKEIDRNTIHLSYQVKNFSVNFVAMDFNIPEKNLYAYKVEGEDDTWINLNHETRITFRNQPPGAYKIRIKGSNSDGIWNETGTYVNVIITPPFWKTSWFKTILIILSMFLVFYLYRKRLRRIELKYKKIDAVKELYIVNNISNREREVIELIVKGKSNKEIEDILFISIKTVNNHINTIFRKMNLKNRGDLMVLFNSLK